MKAWEICRRTAIDYSCKPSEDDPFSVFYRLAFALTVDSHTHLTSATPGNLELEFFVDSLGFGVEDLLAFQLNAAHEAFLQWDQTEDVIDQILEAYTPS